MPRRRGPEGEQPPGENAPVTHLEPPSGRWSVQQEGSRLILRVRWFDPWALATVPLIALPAGLCVAAVSDGISKSQPELFGFAAIVAGLVVWVGAPLAARLLNRTLIQYEPGELRVRHGPLPAPGGGRYRRDELRRIICRTVTYVGTKGREGRQVFDVLYIGKDRRERVLVPELPTAADAGFVRDALTSALALPSVQGGDPAAWPKVRSRASFGRVPWMRG